MKFQDVAPIVEGKLHAWGLLQLQYPGPAIASYKAIEGRQETMNTTSPQERWAVCNALDLKDITIVENTLKKLSPAYQRLIEMRYRDKYKWHQIARSIHVSLRQVHRERDNILAVFAVEFGLLEKKEGTG
jgi:hypothetical protein